jgi:hypothetical protein
MHLFSLYSGNLVYLSDSAENAPRLGMIACTTGSMIVAHCSLSTVGLDYNLSILWSTAPESEVYTTRVSGARVYTTPNK